ncbi:hypothetical protein [Erythrobacter sp. Alg231-14]|uniref:hypothetical protein n=1 Tax=Erythrobacter sp. Alg231-14 TaxID=1922225 RepID=UPI000D55C9DD
MKAIYLQTAGAVVLTFGLGALVACVPASAPPAPTPPPVAAPAPTPTPAPAPAPPPVIQEPVYDNYLDAPQTPGTWLYLSEPGETLALYGENPRQPIFMVRCAAGEIALARATASPSTASRAMSVRTETTNRQLQADRVGDRPLVAANIAARDPLLDAMAITKGRFAVQVEGERTLYLPAWVEVSRVIEDCR